MLFAVHPLQAECVPCSVNSVNKLPAGDESIAQAVPSLPALRAVPT